MPTVGRCSRLDTCSFCRLDSVTLVLFQEEKNILGRTSVGDHNDPARKLSPTFGMACSTGHWTPPTKGPTTSTLQTIQGFLCFRSTARHVISTKSFQVWLMYDSDNSTTWAAEHAILSSPDGGGYRGSCRGSC
jgi:hypothetical protein